MDKFPGIYKLPRLTQTETENLNRPIASKRIDIVKKKKKKNIQQSYDQVISLVNSTKPSRKN